MQMALFRHNILKDIERKLGGSVLAYVESPAGENVELCREDAGAFEELVRGMDKTKKLFIILNTLTIFSAASGSPPPVFSIMKRSRRKADKPESGHAESGAEVALVKARR